VKRNNQLDFPVLSDAHNTYARRLSLVFALPGELRGVYEGFGIALPEYNGDESWELPIPARIAVDARGVIRELDADPDYTRRPEPTATLEALRALT